jgi:hypothetical protein
MELIARPGPARLLRRLMPLTSFLLLVQYVSGLWTSSYGPANGFTSSTSYPPLQVHYAVGVLLAIVVLVVLTIAAMTRETRLLLLSLALTVGVWWAVISGMVFIHSSPNDPLLSVTMGIGFLLAFWASIVLQLVLQTGNDPISIITGPAGERT